jgi:hypothetical protein
MDFFVTSRYICSQFHMWYLYSPTGVYYCRVELIVDVQDYFPGTLSFPRLVLSMVAWLILDNHSYYLSSFSVWRPAYTSYRTFGNSYFVLCNR